MNSKKKIIIVGGGFAGIQLARRLDKNLFEVLLIDKINHHQVSTLVLPGGHFKNQGKT